MLTVGCDAHVTLEEATTGPTSEVIFTALQRSAVLLVVIGGSIELEVCAYHIIGFDVVVCSVYVCILLL